MKFLRLLPLFFLLLTPFGPDPPGGGVGLVDGQLYNELDDVAKIHNLPLALVEEIDKNKTLTCLAKIPAGWTEDFPALTDGRDFFRGRHGHSNYNPHYYCSNVPKFDQKRQIPIKTVEEGHATPYSDFWMREPSAWHWAKRFPQGGGVNIGHELMKSKDMGFIFRVEVTGIKSRGRFLKGWWHLAITLDCDQNVNGKSCQDVDTNCFREKGAVCTKNLADYGIDKLMVTARGRILIPGKNRKFTRNATNFFVERPARRAWVGGIGEFVKDFPTCAEAEYNPTQSYVTSQFMPCGAVQYSESKYGNNFYYSRGHAGRASKYGGGQGEAPKSIHLNFRLDNTFCNRYYDLDFIANGIVMKKSRRIDLDGANQKKSPYTEKDIYAVQRSISTRFAFISSHKYHGPSYYENADPIPRHVTVECKHPLSGEWKMNPNDQTVADFQDEKAGKPVEDDKTVNIPPHTASVTQGADLQLTNAPADATFGGALKFIYNIPPKGSLHLYEKKDFGRRRTWTYPDVFYTSGLGGSDHPGIWGAWRDLQEFQTRTTTPQQKFGHTVPELIAIITAVQRVLHEFDWESWRAMARDDRTAEAKSIFEKYGVIKPPKWQYAGKPGGTPGDPNDNLSMRPKGCVHNVHKDRLKNDYGCQRWCDVHERDYNNARQSGGEYWPHSYYDATCIGIDTWLAGASGTVKTARDPVKSLETGVPEIRHPNKFEKLFPPILGRCATDLYYNDGVGTISSIAPSCNEFFGAYSKKETSDPALNVVIEQQKRSGRKNWFDPDGKKDKVKDAIILCKLMDQLGKEFPDGCPKIPPIPFTPRPRTSLDKEKAKIAKFKTTPAYNRGMMVAETPYTLYIYDSRVLHGLVMTIIVMFITPVSIFLTRYFKETFMDSRIFLHRIWYFAHLSAAFITPLFFIVALWRLVESKALLGVSYNGSAIFHRIFGWTAVATALLLLLLGGIRCMHRCIRGTVILLHFILGFLFYFISLWLIVNSIGIPGSPSAFQDFSRVPEKAMFKRLIEEPIFYIVCGWILFDLIVHIFMTVMQCRNDSKMKLTQPRICFGAGMPVILENYRFDTPGRFCRIHVLRVYVAVALGCTIAVCCFIRLHSPRGRGYGFMTCTHTPPPAYDVATKYLCKD